MCSRQNRNSLVLQSENKMQISTTIQILMARFNGQVLIPLVPASESVGIPAQTARNRLSSGTYPMPTVMIESRRFIHISDLAEFVESRRAPQLAAEESPREKVRKGRPPKSQSKKVQGSVS